MTDRPWRRRFFTWLRKGLAGMPAALRLNEGLGVNAQPLARPKRRWTGQMIAWRVALGCACLAVVFQVFALASHIPMTREMLRPVVLWVSCLFAPEKTLELGIAGNLEPPALCLRSTRQQR